MKNDLVRTSKFLSLVLRHAPERIGLKLEPGGWASVPELIRLAQAAGHALDEAKLERVVAENDKQRYALTPDRAWIRANQGHSIEVDLGLRSLEPPEILYHGTATRNLDSIRSSGLLPGRRQHVHLSADHSTALRVGRRHGAPLVLIVESHSMYAAGETFFRSENGVWLTTRVAPRFIRFPDPTALAATDRRSSGSAVEGARASDEPVLQSLEGVSANCHSITSPTSTSMPSDKNSK